MCLNYLFCGNVPSLNVHEACNAQKLKFIPYTSSILTAGHLITQTGAIAATGRLITDDYPAHLDAVNCSGSETVLTDCILGLHSDGQACSEAGVICQGLCKTSYCSQEFTSLGLNYVKIGTGLAMS